MQTEQTKRSMCGPTVATQPHDFQALERYLDLLLGRITERIGDLGTNRDGRG